MKRDEMADWMMTTLLSATLGVLIVSIIIGIFDRRR